MNLQYLKYIVEIEHCRSISKAAKNLYVSQPYLSKILRETETNYHISIFERSKHGIEPTEAGRVFLDMANELLENAARFENEFENRRNGYRLRVASCTSSHSMDAFIRMVNNLPDNELRFSYLEMSPKEVIEHVYTHHADIGLLFSNPSNRDSLNELLNTRRIISKKLFETCTWLVTGENHPLLARADTFTLEELYQYNLVLYSTYLDSNIHAVESVYGETERSLFDLSRFKQIIYVSNRAALHNILANTDYIGIGVSPAREQDKQFHIVSIPLPKRLLKNNFNPTSHSLSYIYLKDRELPKAARAYITFLENYYGSNSDYPELIRTE